MISLGCVPQGCVSLLTTPSSSSPSVRHWQPTTTSDRIEFLEKCIQGFGNSNIELKYLCLEYITPWLHNLTRLVMHPSFYKWIRMIFISHLNHLAFGQQSSLLIAVFLMKQRNSVRILISNQQYLIRSAINSTRKVQYGNYLFPECLTQNDSAQMYRLL